MNLQRFRGSSIGKGTLLLALGLTVFLTAITLPPQVFAFTVTIAPSPASIDNGQSVSLVASCSGGGCASGYTYQWYTAPSAGTCSASDTLILGATSLTYAASPSTSTYYCIIVTKTSNGATTASSTDFVTVNSALTAGSITPSAPKIDVGQSVLLSASWTGGTSAFTVKWYSGTSPTCSLDTTLVATNSASASPNSQSVSPASNTYYCAVVTDSSSGTPAQSATDAAIQVTVNPALSSVTLGSFTVNPTIVSYSNGVTVSWSGGTANYDVTLYETSSSPCSSGGTLVGSATGVASTSKAFTFNSPSSTGTYYYCATVTDSVAGSASSTATNTLAVDAAPTVGTYSNSGCSLSSSSFNIGGTVYGDIATYSGGAVTPMKLEYVDPSGSAKRTVTGLPGSTYCDGGYALQPADSTGTWTLKLYDNNNVLIASSSYTVNAAVPEFPLGALFLLLPIIMVYMLARGRTRLEQG